MKFDDLTKLDQQINSPGKELKLNKEGIVLLKQYHEFMHRLEEWVRHDAVINLIGVISAEKKGTNKFKLANRLDTMTNGGKTSISNQFTFNEKDPINEFIE